MEVEQMNLVTHLIITVQLSKNPSVKIWSNKFQMVMLPWKLRKRQILPVNQNL